MPKKLVIYEELLYALGLITLALGASLLARANFGMSVVVSPAYLLHLYFSQAWPSFSFGVAEYCVQGFLLLVLIFAVHRFHWSYLFSAVTAVLYGFVLDQILGILPQMDAAPLALRVAIYLVGLFFCALGVASMLHSYLSPEVYELLIREIAQRYRKRLPRVKTVYDCISCTVAILLSFLFFGLFVFRGVGVGTVISALCSGSLVGLVSLFFKRHLTIRAAYPKLANRVTPPPFPAITKESKADQST